MKRPTAVVAFYCFEATFYGAPSCQRRLPPCIPEAKRIMTIPAAAEPAKPENPTSLFYLYQIGRITVKNKVLILASRLFQWK